MTNLAKLEKAAELIIMLCKEKGLRIATAESCTGGLVAGLLTEIPGSSAVVERGFVTYSNEAKHEMLGVPETLLEEYGSVSEEVAHAMAEGALTRSRADIAVAITGIAGPDGGSEEKPVGLVYFCAASTKNGYISAKEIFPDQGRDFIRAESISKALKLIENST